MTEDGTCAYTLTIERLLQRIAENILSSNADNESYSQIKKVIDICGLGYERYGFAPDLSPRCLHILTLTYAQGAKALGCKSLHNFLSLERLEQLINDKLEQNNKKQGGAIFLDRHIVVSRRTVMDI